MKSKILFSFLVTLLVFGCSKDNESGQQSLENASLAFANEVSSIDVPSAMKTVQDPNAQFVSDLVDEFGDLGGFFASLEAQPGAEKSSERIIPVNGRSAQTNNDVLVYTWEDNGVTVAYQISETSDKYIFEVMFKLADDEDWLRYIYAEEKKSVKEGYMEVYGVFFDDESVWLRYEWSVIGDIININANYFDELILLELTLNKSTGAGSLRYYSEDILWYEAIWDGLGNGEWTYYDETGSVDESGTWIV